MSMFHSVHRQYVNAAGHSYPLMALRLSSRIHVHYDINICSHASYSS